MTGPDRRTVLGAALAATAALAAPAAGRACAPHWKARAPMPFATQEIYGAVLDGRAVIAGGFSPQAEGGMTDRCAVYDPRTNQWTEGPRLPAPTHHPFLTAANGRVYAFGGFRRTEAGAWTAVDDVLALEDGAWRTVGRMPAPQSETAGAALGGVVHLVTGRTPAPGRNGRWDDQQDTDAHRVFDPSDGRWRDARPAPEPRNSAAYGVIDGALYVVGGRRVDLGNLARLDRYDPRTDRWETLAPMPGAQGGLAAAVRDGRLIAFGGEWFDRERRGGVFAETWIYDPAADRWTAGPPMATPRHGLAGLTLEGRVYAIGGATEVGARGTSAVVEALD